MNRILFVLIPLLLDVTSAFATTTPVSALHAPPVSVDATSPDEELLPYAGFGTLHIYRKTPHPQHVLIVISGDGGSGWDDNAAVMAKELALPDVLLIGLNVKSYLYSLGYTGAECFDPAGDFQDLSTWVQNHLGISPVTAPVIVGYSAGATLAYIALVQSKPHQFRGAIGFGFCPDVGVGKLFCKGNGLECSRISGGRGTMVKPAASLSDPWVSIVGDDDANCSADLPSFPAEQVPGGKTIVLRNMKHGFFQRPETWSRQYQRTVKDMFSRN